MGADTTQHNHFEHRKHSTAPGGSNLARHQNIPLAMVLHTPCRGGYRSTDKSGNFSQSTKKDKNMCIENAQAKQAEVPNDLCRCRTEPRPIDEELCNIAYERVQIGERIRNLEAAIKANPEAVSEYHKGLWKIQLDAMEGYYNALGERIKDFVTQTERK